MLDGALKIFVIANGAHNNLLHLLSSNIMHERYFRIHTHTPTPTQRVKSSFYHTSGIVGHFLRFTSVASTTMSVHFFIWLATFQNRSSHKMAQDVKNIYCELVTSSRYSFSFRHFPLVSTFGSRSALFSFPSPVPYSLHYFIFSFFRCQCPMMV